MTEKTFRLYRDGLFGGPSSNKDLRKGAERLSREWATSIDAIELTPRGYFDGDEYRDGRWMSYREFSFDALTIFDKRVREYADGVDRAAEATDLEPVVEISTETIAYRGRSFEVPCIVVDGKVIAALFQDQAHSRADQ